MTVKKQYRLKNTDLHHCLMGECINTEGAKQAVMLELEVI